MRNAAATLDAFDSPRPARRTPASRARPANGSGRKKKSTQQPLLPMHGIARYAAIGMAATMALGIMVNALVLQKGHHPAPLFGTSATAGATAGAAPAAPPSRTVAAAPTRTAVADEPAEPAMASAAKKGKVPVPRATAPGGDDAIGRLLAGEMPTAGGISRSAGAKAAENKTAGAKTVSAAQRALTKLGFAVPATGVVGPATRKAIEAFQKDRHLPVKGALDGRMVKLLSAESGLRID